MAQILDPLSNEDNNCILCCYVNATSQIQIARITNIPNWYFERVVFPGQRLVFETEAEGILEIHTGMMASAILSDTIPCSKLALQAMNTASLAQESAKKNQARNKSAKETYNLKHNNVVSPVNVAA